MGAGSHTGEERRSVRCCLTSHRVSAETAALQDTPNCSYRPLEREAFLRPFLTKRKAQKLHVPLLPDLREETLHYSLQKALRCQICELSMKTNQCISLLAYETEDRRGENNKSGKFLVWLLMFSTSMWLTLDDLWIWNITTFWKTRRSVNLKHHAMCWHRECLPLATARRLCRVFGFLHRLKILKCFCSSAHWEYTRV